MHALYKEGTSAGQISDIEVPFAAGNGYGATLARAIHPGRSKFDYDCVGIKIYGI